MRFTLHHNSSKLKIRFTSTLDSAGTDESFGVSDLRIFYCHKENGDCFTSDNKLPLPI